MIEENENSTAANDFKEWAALFSEGLFFMIQVYMDEAGTNDPTGRAKGSSAPTVNGWIATPKYWIGFGRRWKRALGKHNAPYFHFREFAR